MKIAAVLLASLGLAVLWFVAVRSPIPTVQAGQVGATMNFAYVRIEGQVVRGPLYYPDSGYLSFTVADETGEVRVAAYRTTAETLRAEGRIPAFGDHVSVAGTLRVQGESTSLTINVPEHVEVFRPEAEPRTLGSLTPDDYLRRVRVRGQVWSVRQPYEGLTLITLRDTTGAAEVAVPQRLERLTGELLPLEPGQSVEVVGTVDLYRDTPQIVPASVMDLVLLPEEVPVAEPAQIGMLTEADVGRMVEVSGTVTWAEPFSAGFKFGLGDGGAEVTVLLWQDTYEGLPDPAALAPGAQVRAIGEVSTYRGEIEVIPARPMDVEVLVPGTGGTVGSTAPEVPLSALNLDRVGEIVTVQGTVVDVVSFSSGFKFTLDDGTGQVVLLLWLATYDELADPAGLNLSARVRATGRVEEYEGTLQVVPASGVDVEVLTPGQAEAPLRKTGSLTVDDVGTRVAVEGAIARTEPFSGGQRVWIDDGTGEVILLLWDNVYRRVPEQDRLIPGAWVRAMGIVEEYRGRLEVVPVLPRDVKTR
jgi:DNA/RNA endonuclease YhcR with UshA esterase domain